MRRVFLAALLVFAACHSATAPDAGAAAPADAGPPDAGAASAKSDDEVHPNYPDALKGPPDQAASRLCMALYELPEHRRAECCKKPTGAANFTGECERTLTFSIQAKAVTVDAPAVDRCVAALNAQLSGCDWVGPSTPELPTACRNIVVGTLPKGSKCRSALECVSGLRCRGVGPTDLGVCDAPGGEHTGCALAIDPLAAYTRQDIDDDHAECEGFCDRHRCAPTVAAGAACKFDRMCGDGNHCAAGKCAAGAVAHRGDACSAGGCDEGLRCVHDVCAEPKRSGAACTVDGECLGACKKKPGAKKGLCAMGCE